MRVRGNAVECSLEEQSLSSCEEFWIYRISLEPEWRDFLFLHLLSAELFFERIHRHVVSPSCFDFLCHGKRQTSNAPMTDNFQWKCAEYPFQHEMGRLLRIFCGNRASVFVNEHVCLPLHRKSTDGPRQEAEKARQTVWERWRSQKKRVTDCFQQNQ